MATILEQAIAGKLELIADSVRIIRAGGPVGRASAAGLAARFHLDPTQPLGAQFVARGLLTTEEGTWLDGAGELEG